MILVQLHCPRCNRVVHSIKHRPDDWSASLGFESCKCVRTSRRTYVSQSWQDWEWGREIPWADLRPHIERAEREGSTQRVMLLLT